MDIKQKSDKSFSVIGLSDEELAVIIKALYLLSEQETNPDIREVAESVSREFEDFCSINSAVRVKLMSALGYSPAEIGGAEAIIRYTSQLEPEPF